MLPALKAELRKIFTVRSTYIILALATALVVLYAGYIKGYGAAAVDLHNPDFIGTQITGAVGTISVITALVSLLLFAHEYRYGTIMYTLTASNKRSRILLAKILAVTIFVVPVTILTGLFSVLCTVIGLQLHGLHAVHQTFNYWDLLWRSVFFGWGYSMFALVFVSLIRNQVGSIAAFFLIPSTAEALLGLVLKGNEKYLPFTSLQSVIEVHHRTVSTLTPPHALLVSGTYIIAFWIIAWILFMRRDAN